MPLNLETSEDLLERARQRTIDPTADLYDILQDYDMVLQQGDISKKLEVISEISKVLQQYDSLFNEFARMSKYGLIDLYRLPDNFITNFTLGIAYFDRGEYSKAIHFFGDAMTFREELVVHNCLANAYFKNGQGAQGRYHLRQFTRIYMRF